MQEVHQNAFAANAKDLYKAFKINMQNKAAAYFNRCGFETKSERPYILKGQNCWKANIIQDKVSALVERQGCKLHKWIHNGLSSQAMLFNLVGPMVAKDNYAPVEEVLHSKGIILPQGERCGIFEYEDYTILGEDKKNPTSMDFVLFMNKKPYLFVEAKFAESEFGKCTGYEVCDYGKINPLNDPFRCHYNQRGMKYWELLESYGILNAEWKGAEECPLAENYQFFREILFAVMQNGYFVLLYDERNPYFVNHHNIDSGIFTSLASDLPEDIRKRVFGVSMQELFQAMKNDGHHDDWTGKFAEKYDMSDNCIY